MKTNFTRTFFPHDHKEDHFKALDVLRGIAVLLVLLSHSSNSNWMFHEFLNFQRTGKIGVYLFFVLSAYLLDRQIAIMLISKKSNRRYWKNYILRRFLRIYPLFIVALLLHGLLSFFEYPTVIHSINIHSPKLYFPYAIAWGGVLIAAKYGQFGIKKILEWKAFRLLGTISYSAYLFHMIVLVLLSNATNIPENYKIYIFFLATILVAILSYVLIEKPLSKIRLYNREVKNESLKNKS